MADTLNSGKPEWPPLLPVGRHPMTIEELRSLCVLRFPNSLSRPELMRSLELVISRLENVGLPGELWIDGSFLTLKYEPDDVDIVLRLHAGDLGEPNDEQTKAIEWVDENQYDALRCHSFVFWEYPRDDPLYWQGEALYAYWFRQWTFPRNHSELKGVAVYNLDERAFRSRQARKFWWLHQPGFVEEPLRSCEGKVQWGCPNS